MKKNLLIAALALLAAASCQKNNLSQTATGELIVRLGEEPATKVADLSMDEYKINSVQLFVFSSNGELETDVYKTEAANSYSLTTGIGNKVVYAIVNAPRLKYTSQQALVEGLSNLSQNTVNNLVMSGSAPVQVNEYKAGSTTPAKCTVPVKRLVSAIQLATVATSFAGSTLEGSTFTIKEIYVKNVVGKAPYGASAVLTEDQKKDAGNWYNKLKLDTTPLTVTYDAFDPGLAVTAANPLDVNHTLYVYPNASTADNGSATTFTPRPTRLVIHALVTTSADHYDNHFKDKDYYYTFDLPALEANKKYKVNVVISMLGKTTDTDDTKTTAGMAQPSITVQPWDQTIELNYQY